MTNLCFGVSLLSFIGSAFTTVVIAVNYQSVDQSFVLAFIPLALIACGLTFGLIAIYAFLWDMDIRIRRDIASAKS